MKEKSISKYKLAVIIPNWNGAKYISRLLECILRQDFEDWQAFIVDDQSKDNSVDIIEEYTRKDHRIHLSIRNRAPKGAQTCRNIGAELSEGAEYLVFFDNDDEIANYCFSQRVRFMDAHPHLDFGIFPAKGYTTHHYDDTLLVYGYPFYEDTLKAILNETLPIIGWTNIYRREPYISKELVWDERILSLQDTDFNLQSILKGCTYEYAVTSSQEEIKPDYFYCQADKNQKISGKAFSKANSQSHIYLINKTIHSFNNLQKEKYHKDLLGFAIYFLYWTEDRKTITSALLKNPWIKNQKKVWLYLKAYSLAFHSNRLLVLLFSKTFQRYIVPLKEWRELTREKAMELISSHNQEV